MVMTGVALWLGLTATFFAKRFNFSVFPRQLSNRRVSNLSVGGWNAQHLKPLRGFPEGLEVMGMGHDE